MSPSNPKERFDIHLSFWWTVVDTETQQPLAYIKSDDNNRRTIGAAEMAGAIQNALNELWSRRQKQCESRSAKYTNHEYKPVQCESFEGHGGKHFGLRNPGMPVTVVRWTDDEAKRARKKRRVR